jgi:hypothetical protein
MQDLSSEESVKAKRTFKQFAVKHGITIRHYHCNNGCFADIAFKQACQERNQQLTFCSVNAHFQNGIAERAIRDLSDSAHKQLLHVHQCWPAAVQVALWPYALRSAALLHNALPVLEDGTSRLELFSSIQVGANMKHVHTFACPVFALQNALAAGNAVTKWSPRARLGLNLGPSPMHAKNVYLVLNLSTGLVSPQYHCRFDNFFETRKYGGPDVSVSSTWQQLARLGHANELPSQGLFQTLHSPMSTEMPSDINIPLEEPGVSNDEFAVTWDKEIDSNQDPQVTMSQQDAQASQEAEGASPTTSTITAGASRRGRARTMSRKIADSVSQRDFYGNTNMHYMALQSLMGETDEDLFHDAHLELQERVRNPIAFHAEMMGDIMYYHQALKQPDASQFVDAIIKEINGHVDNKHWRLAKRDTIPEEVQIVPSV